MNWSVIGRTREACSSGVWLGVIVPVLLSRTGNYSLALDLCSCVVHLLLLLNTVHTVFVSFLFYSSYICTYFLHTTLSIRSLFVLGFNLFCTRGLLQTYPKTFTIGEALILSHLLTVFIQSSPLFLLAFLTAYFVERYSVRCTFGAVTPLVLMNLSGISFILRKLFPKFYTLYRLRLHSLKCFFTFPNLLLIFTWMILLLLCVSIVWVNRCIHPEWIISPAVNRGPSSLNQTASPNNLELHGEFQDPLGPCVSSSGLTPATDLSRHGTLRRFIHSETPNRYFQLRKLFHICAGLVFTLGLLISPLLLSLCSACLFVAFGVSEWIRRCGPKKYAQTLNDLLGPFRDSRDSGDLIFTPIALLLGLSIPIWFPVPSITHQSVDLSHLCSNWEPPPLAWSGVLSIAIGDTLAALIGRAWGRLRWPGSHRTFLGSAVSYLGQLLFWLLLSRHHRWPWRVGLLPIATGVLVEAYTEQIDNLVVPLVVMTVFTLQPSS
ncbi:unnamed protein product [Dicrocoelium dendriticum]|nr:unnamed protein product [Dicrocoelium dendriticum]